MRVADHNAGRGTDIKSVGVVPALCVAGGVVDGDVIQHQVGRSRDGESLHRGILDVESADGGAAK